MVRIKAQVTVVDRGPGRLLRRVLLQGISLPQRNRRLRAQLLSSCSGGWCVYSMQLSRELDAAMPENCSRSSQVALPGLSLLDGLVSLWTFS